MLFPIQSVESTALKSMHWWHRIVIYCIGFRSILRMNGLRVCVCACKRYRMQTKPAEEQSYKSKRWHFFSLYFGCYAALCCLLQNRICATYVIGTILYASSWFYFVFLSFIPLIQTPFFSCFWLILEMYVFVCLYFTIIDLLNWMALMRCYVTAPAAVTAWNHTIMPKISQKTTKIIINSQAGQLRNGFTKIINHKQVYIIYLAGL